MISSPGVSVCFPAYNEEATIEDVLKEAHELLSSSGLDYEILVCNDGSTDRTKDIIERLAGLYPNFRAIHNSRNLGIYRTFERLYSEAVKDLIFLNSTDRQWHTGVLLKMIPLIKDCDIVIASRKNKYYGFCRTLISWIFDFVPHILFGVPIFDAGAVKLIRREIITRFKLVSQSPFSEAERLIRAWRCGYKVKEYPVEISPRRTGQARGVSFEVLLRSCADVFRVWWSIFMESHPISR